MQGKESVQMILLDMLAYFDLYCEQHNITYYVAGGTLLGAIRHKGFIPWDDDVDVILPRPDYEKLIKTFHDKDGKYELETPYDGNQDYLFTFSKLYDKTTTLIENVRPRCTRGVYIDVFPLDGIGDEDWQKRYNQFDRINMLLMSRICSIRKGRGFIKNASILLMRLIPKFLIDNKKLSIKVAEKASSCNYESSSYVGNLMGAYRKKEIMSKDIFGKPIRLQFEDIFVNGPEKSEQYLKQIYGNWEVIPPPEKRHGAHSYLYMNLNSPYKK